MVAVFIPAAPKPCPNVKLKNPGSACMINPALGIWLVATYMINPNFIPRKRNSLDQTHLDFGLIAVENLPVLMI
jgi:hypothetical protein